MLFLCGTGYVRDATNGAAYLPVAIDSQRFRVFGPSDRHIFIQSQISVQQRQPERSCQYVPSELRSVSRQFSASDGYGRNDRNHRRNPETSHPHHSSWRITQANCLPRKHPGIIQYSMDC